MDGDAAIEIHDVRAHLVDSEGRVRGLRVLGVCDCKDRNVSVQISPGLEDDRRLFLSSYDFGIWQTARLLHPDAVGWPSAAEFRRSRLGETGAAAPRQAYFWCVEFVLRDHPKLPPLTLGLQAVPLRVKASYAWAESEDDASTDVHTLALVEAYPVGVLFVHGVGLQRKAETLTLWTAPMLRHINAWFDAAARRLGERAQPEGARDWLAAVAVRADWSAHDPDTGDRMSLARQLAVHATAKTHGNDRDALAASAGLSLLAHALRKLQPEEVAAGQRYAQHLSGELGVGVVGGFAELADARLIDRDAALDAPSTIELALGALGAAGDVERSTWLMAESHWAESFRAPPFAPFALWCLRMAPVACVHYFALQMERARRVRWRASCTLLPLTSAVLLSGLSILALLLLSLLPWPRLRTALAGLQVSLAGVVGDSYVFLQDEVQRRAIVDRVRRDVRWLSQRCRKVVVVAHSQGAAVADQALNKPREFQPDRLAALVTLGGGVQTLERIGELGDKPSVLWSGGLMLAGASLAWGGLVWSLLGAVAWHGGLLALVGLLVLWLAGMQAWLAHPGWSTQSFAAASIQPWHDFYATRDPVPGGPMRDPEQPVPHYRPHEVSNRHSFASDHTSYWDNDEEIVGPVARLIAQAAGFRALDAAVPDSAALAQWLAQARHTRVRWLSAARWLTWGATAAVAWAQRPALLALARWAEGLAFANWRSALGAGRTPAADFPGSWSIVGTLAVAVPGVVYATLVCAAWAAWGRMESREVLLAQAARESAWGVAAFAFALSVLFFAMAGCLQTVASP